jgi:hypothetical protein
MYVVLPIFVLLLVGAAMVPLQRARRARRNLLAALALRRGWTWHPADPWHLASEIDCTCLGAWGHDHCCRDTVSVPTRGGSLWLGEFTRQMASGRLRRTERYALAIAHLPVGSGGVAILPADQLFAPAQPFGRYRPTSVSDRPVRVNRQVWAERPISDRPTIQRLADLLPRLPEAAAIEARGPLVAIYWPLVGHGRVRDYIALQKAGTRLLEALTPPDGDGNR